MTKTIFSLVAALVLSASAFLAHSTGNLNLTNSSELRFSQDGAFRDGLYLGRLAAQSNQPQHPAIGRWSNDQDRASFTAGYRLGYEQKSILAGANSPAARAAE